MNVEQKWRSCSNTHPTSLYVLYRKVIGMSCYMCLKCPETCTWPPWQYVLKTRTHCRVTRTSWLALPSGILYMYCESPMYAVCEILHTTCGIPESTVPFPAQFLYIEHSIPLHSGKFLCITNSYPALVLYGKSYCHKGIMTMTTPINTMYSAFE